MEYKRRTLPILGLIVLLNCSLFAATSNPPLTQPVATLELSQSLPEERGELTVTAVAFSSESSITVGICRTDVQGLKCSQYVVQWENGAFKHIAQTQEPARWGGRSSADGSRRLFDFSERKVPRLQHLLESLHTLTTLGMSGPEDSNREVVWVIDAVTRNSCFDWRRSFPMTWSRGRFATISPSGELVAITAESKLSIYRLPAVCEGPTKTRDR
jgi:hypothetical protein